MGLSISLQSLIFTTNPFRLPVQPGGSIRVTVSYNLCIDKNFQISLVNVHFRKCFETYFQVMGASLSDKGQ